MTEENASEYIQMDKEIERAETQQDPIEEAEVDVSDNDIPEKPEPIMVRGVQDDSGLTKESAPEVPSSTRFCPQCGTQLKDGMPFCGKCGTKIDNPVTSSPENRSKKSKIKLIIGAVIVVVVVLLAAFFVIPEVTATPDQLIEKGKYETAYQRASDEEKPKILSQIIGHGQFQIAYDSVGDDQKTDVLEANLAAFLANGLLDNLIDPSTFVLRQVYFDNNAHEMILKVSANNSSGGRASNWYDYRFNKDDDEYKLYVSISDMSDETVYKYADTSEEKLEKALKNAARANMRSIMGSKDMELDRLYVDGINELFKSGGLDKVELIPAISSIYPEEAVA